MNILTRILTAINIVKSLKPNEGKFPPLIFCPICNRRTSWIEEGRVWGCNYGHRFDVTYRANATPKEPKPTGEI